MSQATSVRSAGTTEVLGIRPREDENGVWCSGDECPCARSCLWASLHRDNLEINDPCPPAVVNLRRALDEACALLAAEGYDKAVARIRATAKGRLP